MNFVYIFIESSDLTQDEISNRLNIPPDKRISDTNFHQKYTWKKGFENKDIKNLDHEILLFLNQFLQAEKIFDEIKKVAKITLWINLYVGGIDQQNLHLSPCLVRAIDSLGISIDVTVVNF